MPNLILPVSNYQVGRQKTENARYQKNIGMKFKQILTQSCSSSGKEIN
jgi:hypothetical protein